MKTTLLPGGALTPEVEAPRTLAAPISGTDDALHTLETLLALCEGKQIESGRVRLRLSPLLVLRLAVESHGKVWFTHTHRSLSVEIIPVLGQSADVLYAEW